MTAANDFLAERCTSQGIGALTLSGAIEGFARFKDGVPAGEVWYAVVDGDNRETGIGTFDGNSSIARTTIHTTLSNGIYEDSSPTAISLSGEAVVACVWTSQAYSAVLAHLASSTNPHNVVAEQVAYDPSGDPVTSETTLQAAMLDQSKSIEQRDPSASGTLSGGEMSKATDITFVVQAGTGEILDSYTNPGDTDITPVTWLLQSAIFLITSGITTGRVSVYVNSAGNVIQNAGPTDPTQLRNNIFLGFIYYLDGVITDVVTAPRVVKQTATDVYDLLLSNVFISGSQVFPVDSELEIWLDSGSVFLPGANWSTDRSDPNNFTLAQDGDNSTPILFHPVTMDGTIGTPTTTIPKFYNTAGSSLTALNGNNATIHRLYSLGITAGVREYLLVYGQTDYNNAKTAFSNLPIDDNTFIYPSNVAALQQLAHIGVGNDASDFTNLSRAWIVSTVSGKTTSGGAATVSHPDVTSRELVNQHPIEAIGTSGGEQLVDTLADKVVWKNEWSPQEYLENQMVRDGDWTMIANTTTTDRAGPQLIGAPVDAFNGTLVDSDAAANQVIFGTRYTPATSGYVNSYRIYAITGFTYTVALIKDPLGSPVYSDLVEFVADADGWVVLSITPALIVVGAVFDIIARVSNDNLVPITFNGDWNYTTPQNAGAPNAGGIIHADKALDVLSVSTTDDNAGDRRSDLLTLTLGDKIIAGGVTWTIQAVVDNTTYFNFTVSPTSQIADGVQDFIFEAPPSSLLPTNSDANYYAATNTQGLLGIDVAYVDIVPNDNAYGVDINYQDATISPDWDVVATSEGVSVGGSDPSGGGGAVDGIFYENNQNVTQDHTIVATKNAMTTGPLVIDNGVTVTVESGARWVII